MKHLLAIATAIACMSASADIYDSPTIDVSVRVELQDGAKICAKAVKLLMTTRTPEPMSEVDSKAFVSIDGVVSTRKCIEVIFSDMSSPTNGYRVHDVSAVGSP